MKNSKVIIPIIIGVLVGGVGAGIFLWTKQSKPSPIVSVAAPTPVPIELAAWTDPAGFTFDYPKDVSVNPHEEDKENYAHVELTHKDHPGRVIVWMKDLPAPDLVTWVKKEKVFIGASVLDTTLGGKPAKKILITDPAKKLVVGAIDNDVLVTVEGELTDEAYWSDIHQKVVGSLVFVSTGAKSSTQTTAPSEISGGGGGSVEEEEVLE